MTTPRTPTGRRLEAMYDDRRPNDAITDILAIEAEAIEQERALADRLAERATALVARVRTDSHLYVDQPTMVAMADVIEEWRRARAHEEARK